MARLREASVCENAHARCAHHALKRRRMPGAPGARAPLRAPSSMPCGDVPACMRRQVAFTARDRFPLERSPREGALTLKTSNCDCAFATFITHDATAQRDLTQSAAVWPYAHVFARRIQFRGNI